MDDGSVVIDTKMMHVYALHKLAQNGGSFKFNNFPFVIKIKGNGGPMMQIQLATVPTGKVFDTHINPTVSKKEKDKDIEIEEGETIEM